MDDMNGVPCANHWVTVGGDSQVFESASWPQSLSTLPPSPDLTSFVEMLGRAPVSSPAEIRARLDAHVADCPDGVYQPGDWLGLPFPHTGKGVSHPGPSLGLHDVVDSVVDVSTTGLLSFPSVYYCLFKNGIFASIIIFGAMPVGAQEAIVVRADQKL